MLTEPAVAYCYYSCWYGGQSSARTRSSLVAVDVQHDSGHRESCGIQQKPPG